MEPLSNVSDNAILAVEQTDLNTKPVILPFDNYPGHGRLLLGRVPRSGNCRHGYGLRLLQMTRQTNCAYCEMGMVDTYEHWLNMAVDHAIPDSVGKLWNIPVEWRDDYSNRLLCCAACNTFHNRYGLPIGSVCPTTLEEFYQLRDQVFLERWKLIRDSHEKEQAFYKTAVRPLL